MTTGTVQRPALAELAAKLVEVRERREACKTTLQALEFELAAAEAELTAGMTAAGVRGWLHDGRTFTPRVRETWSVRPGRQAEVVAILKAHAPGIVRETVHPATLSCFFRNHPPGVATANWWALLEPCLTRRERACIDVGAARSATWMPREFREQRRT